jgi:hypothetical protein
VLVIYFDALVAGLMQISYWLSGAKSAFSAVEILIFRTFFMGIFLVYLAPEVNHIYL